jgi:hypothetical protein
VAVDEWKRKGANTPSAVIVQDDRMVVSAEFLALGTYLFEEPFDSSPSSREYQRNFDEEAERSLPRLVKLIAPLCRGFPVPSKIFFAAMRIACKRSHFLLTRENPQLAKQPPPPSRRELTCPFSFFCDSCGYSNAIFASLTS